jgi:glycosyltransferase involved in cell wall biosynthesis
VRYTVIGETNNEFYLKRILRKLKKEKLGRNFKLIGYVDDNKLTAYYNGADIICNLRYPAIEGASASLQEQLLQGKTVIVADTGVYSEVPDDCVIKIDPNHMKESLQEKLTILIKDKGLAKRMGQNAAAFAKEEYKAEKYTARIIEFMNKLIFIEPLDNTLGKIKRELEAMGLNTYPGEPRLQIVENIAKNIDEMFACSINRENL